MKFFGVLEQPYDPSWLEEGGPFILKIKGKPFWFSRLSWWLMHLIIYNHASCVTIHTKDDALLSDFLVVSSKGACEVNYNGLKWWLDGQFKRQGFPIILVYQWWVTIGLILKYYCFSCMASPCPSEEILLRALLLEVFGFNRNDWILDL